MSIKIGVVIGALSKLGIELSRRIASRGIGVVLVDRDTAQLDVFGAELNRLHPSSVKGTFAVDLADHADIRRLASGLIEQYGTVDYLFNNAEIVTKVLQFSKHGNELHFEVNTLAPLQLIDYLRPALRRAGSGARVINTSVDISSRATTLDWDQLVKPWKLASHYEAYVNSKLALNVITAALARELSGDRISVRAADPRTGQSLFVRWNVSPGRERLFCSPSRSSNDAAMKISEVAFAPKWDAHSGVLVSNDRVAAFSPTLAAEGFQRDILHNCRERTRRL